MNGNEEVVQLRYEFDTSIDLNGYLDEMAPYLRKEEVEYICKNTNVEIETFIHGALCISYSGQCLFSSMVGARSGNRGKCAGTCRLPYELINKEENKIVDKGYLLSSKDVCTLDIIPEIIESEIMQKVDEYKKNKK